MDEYANRFAIGGGTGGPPRRHVSRSRVAITRNIKSRVSRRDPHRNMTEGEPIISSYGATWDFSLSEDDGSMGVVLAHLCDPGLLTIGATKEMVEVIAYAGMEDGSIWKLEKGTLKDFQLVIEPRKIVKATTAWEFGKLTEAVSFPAAISTASARHASPINCQVAIGALAVPVFSATIAFSREAKPAGFTLAGDATGYAGAIAVDIVGRLTVRLDPDDSFAAIRDRFEDSMTIDVNAGDSIFSIAIPRCTFQVTNRRIVSAGSLDYSIDFLALKTGAQPLATFAQA